jgi:hypothetical protein
MNDSSWTQVSCLTTFEVAADGSMVKLNLLDADGKPASLIVPFALVRVLALSMPKIVRQALCHASGSDSLRLVHEVSDWKIERAENPEYAILTFAAPDLFEVSFAIRDRTLAQMAELMSEFHIEAFPEGLHFH